MPTETTSIAALLAQLDDSELTQYLRALDEVIASARRTEQHAAVRWFNTLRQAGEADYRLRAGVLQAVPYVETALAAAARDLDDLALGALMLQYHELAAGRSTLPAEHAVARIAAICYFVLDLVASRRRPAA